MASTQTVITFCWKLAVILMFLESCRSSDECSFVRSYKNEQCVYNIHLTQNSDPCVEPPRPERRHFRRHLSPQNDYTDKIDSMEKTFSFMKDAHERRLKDLEGTVRGLLGGDPGVASLVPETSVHLSSAAARSAEKRPLDEGMLSMLHEEFAKLREIVKEKTTELFDVQLKLNDTEKMFQKSQVDLFGVNQELLNAENKIALMGRERAILKNQIKDRSYRLGVSSERLTECEQKMGGQEELLLGLIRSENMLSESMMTCELTLNHTRWDMKKMERRHRHLKTRHARVKEVLGVREGELIACYAAKTQTFCGFEDLDLCGFSQPNVTNDFFDWEWGEGSTPSRHTGPSADHTCRSPQGHFMYIEASAKGRGKNAIIYSPLYRGLNPQCLQFHYHMFGRHVGTLNVYAKAQGGEELTSVWRAWGNQGDLWSVARLSIPKELARAGYQIAFEGITENGFEGDMAIDDVSVKDGQCAEGEGVKAVVVQFNSSSLIREGRKFARNIKKLRLSKVPFKSKSKRKENDSN